MNISLSLSLSLREIFQKRLKAARKYRGLSQKGLGIAAGIDEFVASARINRYEKGVHEAKLNVVQRLADVLNVPLAYFYASDDELAELILLFSSLTHEHRSILLQSLRIGHPAVVLDTLPGPK